MRTVYSATRRGVTLVVRSTDNSVKRQASGSIILHAGMAGARRAHPYSWNESSSENVRPSTFATRGMNKYFSARHTAGMSPARSTCCKLQHLLQNPTVHQTHDEHMRPLFRGISSKFRYFIVWKQFAVGFLPAREGRGCALAWG